MAAKITRAIVNGELVAARDYVSGTARCEFCNIKLVRNRAHNRGNARVEAYYRRADGEVHGACKYNEGRRVERLVRFSIGFTGSEPIVLDREGRAVFRLDIIGNALNQLRNGQLPQPIRDMAGNVSITAERVQTQSLRTAKSVLGLAARIEELPELANLIRIRNRDDEIRWRDFFYRDNAMQRLLAAAVNGIAFPVAIAVRVRMVVPPDAERGTYMISCHGTWMQVGDRRLHFSPTLRTSDPACGRAFTVGDWFLVFAKPGNLNQRDQFCNLNISIDSPHQISRYHPGS